MNIYISLCVCVCVQVFYLCYIKRVKKDIILNIFVLYVPFTELICEGSITILQITKFSDAPEAFSDVYYLFNIRHCDIEIKVNEILKSLIQIHFANYRVIDSKMFLK